MPADPYGGGGHLKGYRYVFGYVYVVTDVIGLTLRTDDGTVLTVVARDLPVIGLPNTALIGLPNQ